MIPFECKEIATCLDGFTNPPSYDQCVALGPTREDSIRLDFSKQKPGNKVTTRWHPVLCLHLEWHAFCLSVGASQHCAQHTRSTPGFATSIVVTCPPRAQRCAQQCCVEIGTQAGALVFHIAMEDVFMWSCKARQFLNKCRDFMAVTDDVRPAGYVHVFSPCARVPGVESSLSAFHLLSACSRASTRTLPCPNLC